MSKNKLGASLDKLFEEYDKARATAKEADAQKTFWAEEVKSRLTAEKLNEVETPRFTCVWKCDKDKEEEVFDEEKFAEKDPKKYKQYIELMEEMKAITKKYTKKVVIKGTRKLLINRVNEEEA